MQQYEETSNQHKKCGVHAVLVIGGWFIKRKCLDSLWLRAFRPIHGGECFLPI